MSIGFSEILVIFILAYFVLGKEKMLNLAKSLGSCMKKYKKMSDEIVEPFIKDEKEVK